MKEIKVSVNTWYVVEGTAGATVTNPSTNRVIATVEDGKQASFYATTPYVLASDDSVSVYKATFNSAPAKLRLLGLLGGGSSTGSGSVLPAGYLAAEFLESTGNQCIGMPYSDYKLKQSADIQFTKSATSVAQVMGLVPAFTCFWGERNGSYYIGSATEEQHFNPLERHYVSFEANALTQKRGTRFWVDGVLSLFINNVDLRSLDGNIYFFGFPNAHLCHARIFSAKIEDYDGNIINDLIFALDDKGVPCMFDKLTSTPHYNTNTKPFVAGFTLTQARKLSKLPATGGTLTVSLPTGYESDAGVMTSLETARSNGWTLTVQTYEAEAAAASTFGMRRIWVRRTQDENGMYIDADGTRWQVDWCVTMYTPDGSTPDAHGYELFRSQEAAVAYWELQPWVDPEAEELLTEYNANE